MLALAGFFASAAVHGAALLGVAAPSYVFALHVGVFLVFFPAVLLQRRLLVSGDRRRVWSELLRGCPGWIAALVPLLFVYTFFNFARDAAPQHEDAVKTIRIFSGHWMLFYYASFSIILSFRRLCRQML
jgi:hypothetical protein